MVLKVLVTGGTGLIGSHLVKALKKRGDNVIIASRSYSGTNYVNWDPSSPGSLRLPSYTDAVVHLAGAPLFGKRWDDSYKRTIRESRVQGTRTVVQAIRDFEGHLDVFLSSSAVGYYGDRGEEELTEESEPGNDFLSEVCSDWEQVALEFGESVETRVSVLRTGIVLSMQGGALRRMLNPFPGVWPFHMGMGGPLGNGQHYMPWIHMADEVGIMLHLLDHEHEGPVNLTSPNPVRNIEFTRALSEVLHRPAFLPVPRFGLKMMYGEAADILFASQRVIPDRMLEAGYEFQFPEIRGALEDLLG